MPAPKTAVVEALQKDLALHWGAAEAYQLIGEHLGRWGYSKLGERYKADAEEERGHIAKLVARLEFYDVQPSVIHTTPEWPRHDFAGILDVTYQIESDAANVERVGYAACLAAGDPVSADTFLSLLADSEQAIREIEAAMSVIKQIGLDNYLADLV